MTKLLIYIVIGVVAGIVDIIPMIIKKMDRFSIISAFVHWVVLGVLIPYVQLPWAGWFKGILIAELSALPIMILVMKDEPESIIPIVTMSAILGAGVGFATARFAI